MLGVRDETTCRPTGALPPLPCTRCFAICGFSEEAEDFLKKCLVRDPKSRWTVDMLLGHPFVLAADGVFIGSIREERNRVVHP
ncbi:unnamed protein product [Camellia sinensis]